VSNYIRKYKTDFEFPVTFIRGKYTIKVERWKINDDKNKGRNIKVNGYGYDGQLYDAVANITKNGITSIKVDPDSGRFE